MVILAAATWIALAPPVVHTQVKGSIEASLATQVGNDAPALGAQVARLLRFRGDINKNVHPGDLLSLMFEHAPEPELLALAYHGSEITLFAYRFRGADGIDRYYDDQGTLIEPRILHSPVLGYVQITELVQKGRGKRKHNGLDFKAPVGTPVVMPFDGVVARVNWSTRVNGKCVEVVYKNGHVGRFLHLDRVDKGVIAGAHLAAGAAVGAVGNSGRSLAPHLHYEIRSQPGDVLDPLKIHGTEKATVPAGDRAAFDAARAQLRARLTPTPTETSVR